MNAVSYRVARKLTMLVLFAFSPAGLQADPGIYQHVLRSTASIGTTSGVPLASGVLVDLENQLVVTNYHVVGDLKEVRVYFSAYDENGELITDHRTYQQSFSALNDAGIATVGRVVARWKARDLALVQLSQLPIEAQALPLADAGAQPGQNIHSVGNSGVTSAQHLWRYTRGVVRNVFQLERLGGYLIKDAKILETDAPINGGDSGGPVVNDRGELVGIVMGHDVAIHKTANGDVRESRLVSHAVELGEVRALMDWYYTQVLQNTDAQVSAR